MKVCEYYRDLNDHDKIFYDLIDEGELDLIADNVAKIKNHYYSEDWVAESNGYRGRYNGVIVIDNLGRATNIHFIGTRAYDKDGIPNYIEIDTTVFNSDLWLNLFNRKFPRL